jgi:hypothetical protein
VIHIPLSEAVLCSENKVCEEDVGSPTPLLQELWRKDKRKVEHENKKKRKLIE